jgi:hypothetical protein
MWAVLILEAVTHLLERQCAMLAVVSIAAVLEVLNAAMQNLNLNFMNAISAMNAKRYSSIVASLWSLHLATR